MGKCEECQFYVPDKDKGYGDCRRYPPVMVLLDKDLRATGRWPKVDKTEGCGEYQKANRLW